MKVKGFYTGQSEGEISVRVGILSFFEELIIPEMKEVFKDGDFRIIKVVENNKYNDVVKELEGFDVHFEIELPSANIKKGTKAFSDLEEIVQSRLEIVN